MPTKIQACFHGPWVITWQCILVWFQFKTNFILGLWKFAQNKLCEHLIPSVKIVDLIVTLSFTSSFLCTGICRSTGIEGIRSWLNKLVNTIWVVWVCMWCFPDCDMSCLTCSGPHPSSCLSCRPNMRKDVNGHCEFYSNCSLNTFEDEDGQCKPCHASCLHCSGAGEHLCLSCRTGFYLHSEFLALLFLYHFN